MVGCLLVSFLDVSIVGGKIYIECISIPNELDEFLLLHR